jgi:ribosomal protein S18 acetylase RimI-like enzyme
MASLAARFFTAVDSLLRSVRPTWWGAVVTDDRFPDIYDLNYARVTAEDPDLGLDEVLAELRPALTRGGSRHEHVVVLTEHGARRLIEEARGAGHRVSHDSVMEFRSRPKAVTPSDVLVVEADPDHPSLWVVLRSAYREFDVTAPNVVEQLLAWNREVLAPAGRRYFVAHRDGRVAGMGAIQVRDGVAYVDDVVTFPEHRRRGVASAVVRRLVKETTGADATFLLADQPDPIRLYRSLGFEETGRLVSTLYGSVTTGSGDGIPR